MIEILRFAQTDNTTFCYRRVLQQQVKRSKYIMTDTRLSLQKRDSHNKQISM